MNRIGFPGLIMAMLWIDIVAINGSGALHSAAHTGPNNVPGISNGLNGRRTVSRYGLAQVREKLYKQDNQTVKTHQTGPEASEQTRQSSSGTQPTPSMQASPGKRGRDNAIRARTAAHHKLDSTRDSTDNGPLPYPESPPKKSVSISRTKIVNKSGDKELRSQERGALVATALNSSRGNGHKTDGQGLCVSGISYLPGSDVTVCCAESCGKRCGNCNSDLGRASDCCPASILASHRECSFIQAPCYVRKNKPQSTSSALLADGPSANIGSKAPPKKTVYWNTAIVDDYPKTNVAFVVFYSAPSTRVANYKISNTGNMKRGVPAWAKFDSEQDSMDKMIRLNFESARLTHPECRLVILTDMTTQFNVNELQPDLPGPRIEVLRMNKVDPKEEMMSRMRARIQLLEQESGTHNLVLLDTDMLVVRSLAHVFEDDFDVALTWRHEINMPINGGIVFVRRNRITKARKFFQTMLNITEDLMGSDTRRRWFGASDQVALASILTREHGYTGIVPGTASSKRKLPSTAKIRTAFNPVMQKIEKGAPISSGSNPPSHSKDTLDVLLLSCSLYNGSGAPVKSRSNPRVCTGHKCCCNSKSAIIHFKGRFKKHMFDYWSQTCFDKEMYKCSVIANKCRELLRHASAG